MDERERARNYGKVATIAFTVGISAAVASATLWFTGAQRNRTAKQVRVGVLWNGARATEGTIVVEGSY
jgi:hypothetical protein